MMSDGVDVLTTGNPAPEPELRGLDEPGASWLSWSKEARLASQLWFAVDSANRFVLLKRWGLTKTCEIEFNFLRKHQETHFIDGCRKLELEHEPAVVRCAKYHVLSNVLGGLDQGYQEDAQGRAWVFYLPPMSMAESPLSPGCGAINLPKEIWLTGFRAWHANNGALLGNDRLFFTVTDLISEGGPFDGGGPAPFPWTVSRLCSSSLVLPPRSYTALQSHAAGGRSSGLLICSERWCARS
jgi:hypothetical protein